MRQAAGHQVPGKEDWVYMLVKALYGTKQAAHAWQQHLKALLAMCDCQSLIVDPATYVRRQGTAFVMIGTHVDDLFVLHNAAGEKLKVDVWEQLSRALTIKDLGDAVWMLLLLLSERCVYLSHFALCSCVNCRGRHNLDLLETEALYDFGDERLLT